MRKIENRTARKSIKTTPEHVRRRNQKPVWAVPPSTREEADKTIQAFVDEHKAVLDALSKV